MTTKPQTELFPSAIPRLILFCDTHTIPVSRFPLAPDESSVLRKSNDARSPDDEALGVEEESHPSEPVPDCDPINCLRSLS